MTLHCIALTRVVKWNTSFFFSYSPSSLIYLLKATQTVDITTKALTVHFAVTEVTMVTIIITHIIMMYIVHTTQHRPQLPLPPKLLVHAITIIITVIMGPGVVPTVTTHTILLLTINTVPEQALYHLSVVQDVVLPMPQYTMVMKRSITRSTSVLVLLIALHTRIVALCVEWLQLSVHQAFVVVSVDWDSLQLSFSSSH